MIGGSAEAGMGAARSRLGYLARRTGKITAKTAVVAACIYVAGALALFAPNLFDRLARRLAGRYSQGDLARR